MSHWVLTYVALAGAAFAISLAATALLIRLAPRLGLIDEPAAEKFHHRPTPVAGGLAILLALSPLLVRPELRGPHTLLLLLGSLVLAGVGLVDDRRGVPAWIKFSVLLALTAWMGRLGLGAHTSRIDVLDFAISVLWIAGVSSAFNAIDNMDGLAPGVAAIAAACFVAVALQSAQWELGAVSATLLGGCLGFLVFNFHPARIFLGDTGSFFLGFILAALGVLGEWNANPLIAAVIPVLILGLPIFDLAFTVCRRHWTGVTHTLSEVLHHCDTDHLSHRLVRLGLGTRGAVGLLYLLAASLGLSALTLRSAAPADAVLHLLQAAVIVAAMVPLLVLAEGRPRPAVAAAPAGRRLPWALAGLGLFAALILLG